MENFWARRLREYADYPASRTLTPKEARQCADELNRLEDYNFTLRHDRIRIAKRYTEEELDEANPFTQWMRDE